MILITGGAGFIGSNSALSFYKDGWQVVVVDNLSRKGVHKNKDWLQSESNGKILFHEVDVCDSVLIPELINKYKPEVVLHLAAQFAKR